MPVIILKHAKRRAGIKLSRALEIGRQPENDLVLDAQGVSRRHARIDVGPDTATVIDVGSKNGTFVNERRISGAHALQPGDEIRVGLVRLTYLQRDDLPEGLRELRIKPSGHKAITFRCCECGAMLQAPAERAGHKGKCQKCKTRFLVPESNGADAIRIEPRAIEKVKPQGLAAADPMHSNAVVGAILDKAHSGAGDDDANLDTGAGGSGVLAAIDDSDGAHHTDDAQSTDDRQPAPAVTPRSNAAVGVVPLTAIGGADGDEQSDHAENNAEARGIESGDDMQAAAPDGDLADITAHTDAEVHARQDNANPTAASADASAAPFGLRDASQTPVNEIAAPIGDVHQNAAPQAGGVAADDRHASELFADGDSAPVDAPVANDAAATPADATHVGEPSDALYVTAEHAGAADYDNAVTQSGRADADVHADLGAMDAQGSRDDAGAPDLTPAAGSGAFEAVTSFDATTQPVVDGDAATADHTCDETHVGNDISQPHAEPRDESATNAADPAAPRSRDASRRSSMHEPAGDAAYVDTDVAEHNDQAAASDSARADAYLTDDEVAAAADPLESRAAEQSVAGMKLEADQTPRQPDRRRRNAPRGQAMPDKAASTDAPADAIDQTSPVTDHSSVNEHAPIGLQAEGESPSQPELRNRTAPRGEAFAVDSTGSSDVAADAIDITLPVADDSPFNEQTSASLHADGETPAQPKPSHRTAPRGEAYAVDSTGSSDIAADAIDVTSPVTDDGYADAQSSAGTHAEGEAPAQPKPSRRTAPRGEAYAVDSTGSSDVAADAIDVTSPVTDDGYADAQSSAGTHAEGEAPAQPKPSRRNAPRGEVFAAEGDGHADAIVDAIDLTSPLTDSNTVNEQAGAALHDAGEKPSQSKPRGRRAPRGESFAADSDNLSDASADANELTLPASTGGAQDQPVADATSFRGKAVQQSHTGRLEMRRGKDAADDGMSANEVADATDATTPAADDRHDDWAADTNHSVDGEVSQQPRLAHRDAQRGRSDVVAGDASLELPSDEANLTAPLGNEVAYTSTPADAVELTVALGDEDGNVDEQSADDLRVDGESSPRPAPTGRKAPRGEAYADDTTSIHAPVETSDATARSDDAASVNEPTTSGVPADRKAVDQPQPRRTAPRGETFAVDSSEPSDRLVDAMDQTMPLADDSRVDEQSAAGLHVEGEAPQPPTPQQHHASRGEAFAVDSGRPSDVAAEFVDLTAPIGDDTHVNVPQAMGETLEGESPEPQTRRRATHRGQAAPDDVAEGESHAANVAPIGNQAKTDTIASSAATADDDAQRPAAERQAARRTAPRGRALPIDAEAVTGQSDDRRGKESTARDAGVTNHAPNHESTSAVNTQGEAKADTPAARTDAASDAVMRGQRSAAAQGRTIADSDMPTVVGDSTAAAANRIASDETAIRRGSDVITPATFAGDQSPVDAASMDAAGHAASVSHAKPRRTSAPQGYVDIDGQQTDAVADDAQHDVMPDEAGRQYADPAAIPHADVDAEANDHEVGRDEGHAEMPLADAAASSAEALVDDAMQPDLAGDTMHVAYWLDDAAAIVARHGEISSVDQPPMADEATIDTDAVDVSVDCDDEALLPATTTLDIAQPQLQRDADETLPQNERDGDTQDATGDEGEEPLSQIRDDDDSLDAWDGQPGGAVSREPVGALHDQRDAWFDATPDAPSQWQGSQPTFMPDDASPQQQSDMRTQRISAGVATLQRPLDQRDDVQPVDDCERNWWDAAVVVSEEEPQLGSLDDVIAALAQNTPQPRRNAGLVARVLSRAAAVAQQAEQGQHEPAAIEQPRDASDNTAPAHADPTVAGQTAAAQVTTDAATQPQVTTASTLPAAAGGIDDAAVDAGIPAPAQTPGDVAADEVPIVADDAAVVSDQTEPALQSGDVVAAGANSATDQIDMATDITMPAEQVGDVSPQFTAAIANDADINEPDSTIAGEQGVTDAVAAPPMSPQADAAGATDTTEANGSQPSVDEAVATSGALAQSVNCEPLATSPAESVQPQQDYNASPRRATVQRPVGYATAADAAPIGHSDPALADHADPQPHHATPSDQPMRGDVAHAAVDGSSPLTADDIHRAVLDTVVASEAIARAEYVVHAITHLTPPDVDMHAPAEGREVLNRARSGGSFEVQHATLAGDAAMALPLHGDAQLATDFVLLQPSDVMPSDLVIDVTMSQAAAQQGVDLDGWNVAGDLTRLAQPVDAGRTLDLPGSDDDVPLDDDPSPSPTVAMRTYDLPQGLPAQLPQRDSHDDAISAGADATNRDDLTAYTDAGVHSDVVTDATPALHEALHEADAQPIVANDALLQMPSPGDGMTETYAVMPRYVLPDEQDCMDRGNPAEAVSDNVATLADRLAHQPAIDPPLHAAPAPQVLAVAVNVEPTDVVTDDTLRAEHQVIGDGAHVPPIDPQADRVLLIDALIVADAATDTTGLQCTEAAALPFDEVVVMVCHVAPRMVTTSAVGPAIDPSTPPQLKTTAQRQEPSQQMVASFMAVLDIAKSHGFDVPVQNVTATSDTPKPVETPKPTERVDVRGATATEADLRDDGFIAADDEPVFDDQFIDDSARHAEQPQEVQLPGHVAQSPQSIDMPAPASQDAKPEGDRGCNTPEQSQAHVKRSDDRSASAKPQTDSNDQNAHNEPRENANLIDWIPETARRVRFEPTRTADNANLIEWLPDDAGDAAADAADTRDEDNAHLVEWLNDPGAPASEKRAAAAAPAPKVMCGHCGKSMAMADLKTHCKGCGQVYHATCWRNHNGCIAPECSEHGVATQVTASASPKPVSRGAANARRGSAGPRRRSEGVSPPRRRATSSSVRRAVPRGRSAPLDMTMMAASLLALIVSLVTFGLPSCAMSLVALTAKMRRGGRPLSAMAFVVTLLISMIGCGLGIAGSWFLFMG